jgi:hypothetical protein
VVCTYHCTEVIPREMVYAVRLRRCMLLSRWSASAWEMWTGVLFLLSQESGRRAPNVDMFARFVWRLCTAGVVAHGYARQLNGLSVFMVDTL